MGFLLNFLVCMLTVPTTAQHLQVLLTHVTLSCPYCLHLMRRRTAWYSVSTKGAHPWLEPTTKRVGDFFSQQRPRMLSCLSFERPEGIDEQTLLLATSATTASPETKEERMHTPALRGVSMPNDAETSTNQ